MKLNIAIEETIKKRVSTRTYKEKKLTQKDKDKLMKAMESITNPFNEDVRIHLIEKDTSSNGEKLGTYGVIKGAKTYLGVTNDKTKLGPLAAGYQFENLILLATDMGLGTVWLAATFSRNQFEKAMGIREDELFPAISPIGYPSEKRSIKENVMRKTMQSDKRKPWEELFFHDSFGNTLSKEEANEYKQPLEMLRLAPSATNAQPWRVVKKNGFYHFFETHKKDADEGEIMIKNVDLGIAISHFHQTALNYELLGNFETVKDLKIDLPANTNYVISWKIESN